MQIILFILNLAIVQNLALGQDDRVLYRATGPNRAIAEDYRIAYFGILANLYVSADY